MRWRIEKRTGSNLIAHLLSLRGISNKDKFLNPSPPSSLTTKEVGLNRKELATGLDRIHQAIKRRERIVIYGDYDVDGVAGTAIIWEALHGLGADVVPYLPDRRTEGYGFSVNGIEQVLKKHSPNLIISVDHGITAADEVALLAKEGIDVIVTDHHHPPAATEIEKLLKNAEAVMHTMRLSGTGIAWYLARSLMQEDDDEHLGLAALGTIADVVPLVGPNRQISRYGLKVLTNTNRVGLRALKEEAGIMDVVIDPYHIGYILGPRINAAGRIEYALDALRLLCTNDETAAMSLAQKLSRINRKRQKLLEDQLKFSLEYLRQAKILPPLIILADEAYEEGIIGLIAGKLVERYWRPTVVIAQGKNGISKASARSIPGVDIIALIRGVEDLLLSAGGHPLAAGFTVQTELLPAVVEKLLRLAGEKIEPKQLTRILRIDAEIEIKKITQALYNQLAQFAPFGVGNPEPLFCTRGAYLENARSVGVARKHLKFTVGGIDAIAFGRGHLPEKLNLAEPVDIAYTLNLNHWNGNEILQLKIRDIKQGD